MFLNQSTFFSNPENLNALISLAVLAILALVIFRFYKSKPFEEYENQDLEILPFIQLGKFMFLPNEKVLQIDDEIIKLSEQEALILELLTSRTNQIVESELIQQEVWEEDEIATNNLDVLISSLREKLASDSAIKIKNIPGKGYKLRI